MNLSVNSSAQSFLWSFLFLVSMWANIIPLLALSIFFSLYLPVPFSFLFSLFFSYPVPFPCSFHYFLFPPWPGSLGLVKFSMRNSGMGVARRWRGQEVPTLASPVQWDSPQGSTHTRNSLGVLTGRRGLVSGIQTSAIIAQKSLRLCHSLLTFH